MKKRGCQREMKKRGCQREVNEGRIEVVRARKGKVTRMTKKKKSAQIFACLSTPCRLVSSRPCSPRACLVVSACSTPHTDIILIFHASTLGSRELQEQTTEKGEGLKGEKVINLTPPSLETAISFLARHARFDQGSNRNRQSGENCLCLYQ